MRPAKKIKLSGFNNLAWTLSYNIYDTCYAKTEQHWPSTSSMSTKPTTQNV